MKPKRRSDAALDEQRREDERWGKTCGMLEQFNARGHNFKNNGEMHRYMQSGQYDIDYRQKVVATLKNRHLPADMKVILGEGGLKGLAAGPASPGMCA